MRPAKSELIDKILLALDRQPSSIYDILYALADYSDLRRTRLPKILKAMEKENLVVSDLQPGPLGPYRRVYELGPNAESRIRHNLRNSIKTILHFYDDYRKSNPQKLYSFPEKIGKRRTGGCILFASFPIMTSCDIDTIRELLAKAEYSSLFVLGPVHMLSKTGIKYNTVGENPARFVVDDQIFSEILLNGVPQLGILEELIAECKRTLCRRGLLKIRVPLAFFEELTKPALGDFIQVTAANLFPDLGILEGKKVTQTLDQYFSNNGVYETSLGEVVFWAIKS